MSDKMIDAVKQYLYNQNRPNQTQSIDSSHLIEMNNGKRVKRVIDKTLTNQNYYRMKTIQQPLLDHYENVDWFERDTSHDLSPYIGRI